MVVFEIKLKVFLLKDLQLSKVQSKVTRFIDSGLSENKNYLNMHLKNGFKEYCFDSLYPIESEKIYKKNNIYTVTIRTINKELAVFFSEQLSNFYNDDIKGLTSEVRIIPKKHIEKIYSITPVVLKNDNGYWRKIMTIEQFEKRLKDNLIKKYNYITGEKLNEDFQFYTAIEFKNKKPISIEYKNVKLLGDKISLNICENDTAQKLAYLALGMGILENNSRGQGFCNYRWL